MLEPNQFRFLNETRRLSSASDWNGGADKLWLYHLHYFDDLNADYAQERAGWHEDLIRRWIAENPPGQGSGWEPYPISLRIVNLIKWLLPRNQEPAGLLDSLATQVRWLTHRLEWHLLGNHLFVNAKALIFAGLFFQGREAERWLDIGSRILVREIPEQILADGGHFELSPMYHALILEDLLDLCNLFNTVGAQRPRIWTDAVTRMRDWLATMTHPDGEIALFNDAALAVAPTPAELERYAERLGFAPYEAPTADLKLLSDSGYARLTAGAATLLVDVGAIGPDYLPAHAHADTLSFELSIGNSRVIVDSGTSVYGSGAERTRQRSTAAHNTVVIDGANSSEVWGGFRVGRRARIQNRGVPVDSAPGEVAFQASHDGYMRCKGRPLHQRVWRLSEERLEIEDEITGTGEHALEVRFHLHPEIQTEYRKSAIQLLLPDGERVDTRLSDSLVWSEVPATYHPGFGLTIPTTCIVGHTNAKLPFRCKTAFRFPGRNRLSA